MQPTLAASRPGPIPPISPIPAQREPTKQEKALEVKVAADAIDAANKARLNLITQKSQAFQNKLLEQTLRQHDLEKEAISQAEEQHQRDMANLREGRQMRKLAWILDVMDEQRSNGQVSLNTLNTIRCNRSSRM